MNEVTTQLIFFGAYIVLFFAVIVGLWLWQIRRRGKKLPVDFKLRRGPGESLRRRMARSDEKMIFIISGAALAPILAGLGVLRLMVWFLPHLEPAYRSFVTAVPALVVLFFTGRYLGRRFAWYRNDRLAWLGERAVGETIEPLIMAGYHLFHDVPAVTGKFNFNVDHVAVGPNGVFALETETRRKGRTRSGLAADKVTYDGRQLIWPWAEESHALKNAQDRAWWLNDWLTMVAGLNVVAQPVLVLPGWEVVTTGPGPVLVVNQQQLAGAIGKCGNRILTVTQIELIARQLDQLCRDLEE